MADNSEDKILINVGLNADEAVQGITTLGQKIDEVGRKDLGSSSVQSYKFQIRDLTSELQKVEQAQGRNSQAFRDGLKELGRLKLAATDFKQAVEGANPALGSFGQLVPIARGAAVAMTGAAGAMALFGIKGEKAEAVMLKLQGILALSHALSGVHELTNGYNALINVLGLASTAAQKVDVAAPGVQAAGAAGTPAADTEAIASKEALTVATDNSTEAQLAYNATLTEGAALSAAAAEANIAQAVTTEAVTVAEEGSTVAAAGLKVALWAIGIGLITTAIAFLISNWKEVKQSITDLFPVLSQTTGVFKDFENDLLGVGSAVLHVLKSPIDEAVTAIKILIDVLKGDFKQASKDFQDGVQQQMADLNVVANFKSGKAKAEAKDAEEANKVRVQSEIDGNERIIKERKALGENTTALEVKNQQLKNSLLDKDADDYQKKLLDGQSEITVLQNGEIKKRNDAAEKLRKEAADKAAATRKQDLDKLKAGNDEASKVINEGLRSQRDIEIADAEFKYNKLIAIATKYGQDATKLEEALGLEKSRINKKYSDEVMAYISKSDESTLSEFDKMRLEIGKEADAAMKNADAEEKALIERNKAFLLAQVANTEQKSNAVDSAEDNLVNTENKNRATPGGKDNLQVKYQKEQAIRDARLVKLKADYEKEQALAKGNAQKLKEIEDKYLNDKGDAEAENQQAAIDLAKAEKDAKLQSYQDVSNALASASDIAGKSTAEGKALAIAGATISTYLSAQKAYESMSAIPIVGPELGFVAAGAAVVAGLANVKAILSVKTPGGSAGGTTTPSYQAPTINSTVLNQAQQGVQNVNVLNQPDANKQPVRAYVVEKDITSKQDRAAYLNRQSTI